MSIHICPSVGWSPTLSKNNHRMRPAKLYSVYNMQPRGTRAGNFRSEISKIFVKYYRYSVHTS
ncbi:unnamed protein product [Moneuplotes crassus]|uniref:Uncharacterized protein n=1 Tax=Euplotes crassus TaxID=5936 RepID=A0AAD2D8Z6_EUPCR|nr:unnamed protein product [Moneuplotes crassus]